MELIHVPSYVIVNKSCSDRVGGREDMKSSGSFRKKSVQIACRSPARERIRRYMCLKEALLRWKNTEES